MSTGTHHIILTLFSFSSSVDTAYLGQPVILSLLVHVTSSIHLHRHLTPTTCPCHPYSMCVYASMHMLKVVRLVLTPNETWYIVPLKNAYNYGNVLICDLISSYFSSIANPCEHIIVKILVKFPYCSPVKLCQQKTPRKVR